MLVCILYVFYVFVYVCFTFPVTWLRDTGWSNARDACDELLLLCCPYVRDLRSCCYCLPETCFAEIRAQYLMSYCKLKKSNMQEKVKTVQVRQNQNQIWQKKKNLQAKWKLIIWSWCCVCITAKEIPCLWVIARWYCEWLCARLLWRE